MAEVNHLVYHENISLIEVEDDHILDQIFADTQNASYLMTRLDSRTAVVAPGKIKPLLERLIQTGYLPKVLGDIE